MFLTLYKNPSALDTISIPICRWGNRNSKVLSNLSMTSKTMKTEKLRFESRIDISLWLTFSLSQKTHPYFLLNSCIL